MSIMMSKPFSSASLSSISSALTHFVNFMDLGTDRDLIVHCFDSDVEGWNDLPAAWHRPLAGDIVVNVAKATQSFAAMGEDVYGEGYFNSRRKGSTAPWKLNSDTIGRIASNIRNYVNHDDKRTHFTSFAGHDKSRYNDRTVIAAHKNLKYAMNVPNYGTTGVERMTKVLLGVILHETGHSVYSRHITEKWFAKTTGYERRIMTMFEELRCERQQIARVGIGSNIVRLAADLVVDPGAIVKDIKSQLDADGVVNVPNLALNSILTLGRVTYDVFLEHEVSDLSKLVSDVVGNDRRDEMTVIWDEFSGIRETDPDRMIDCAKRWSELFPSSEDGSSVNSSVAPKVIIVSKKGSPGEGGADTKTVEIDDDTIIIYMDDEDDSDGDSGDSSGSDKDDASGEGSEVDSDGGGDGKDGDGSDDKGSSGNDADETVSLPGIAKDFAKDVEEAAREAAENPTDDNHEWNSRGITPSKKAYDKAVDSTTKKASTVYTEKPSAADYMMAKRLAKDLENLNVSGRGKFVVASATPPGRMNSRQAVQRSAERSRGQMSTAKPWKRVKHTVDINPPLTVGVMTDVSGSQGWAEMLSARMSWILSQSVVSIGGRTASVAFGDEALITLRPGEHPENLTVVEADGGTEQFDWAAGTIDTLLNLTNGAGVRLLFVMTDGWMVKPGEMKRMNEWVDKFAKSGTHVFWITPEGTTLYQGYPISPIKSTIIEVDKYDVRENPMTLVNQIATTVKRELAMAKRR